MYNLIHKAREMPGNDLQWLLYSRLSISIKLLTASACVSGRELVSAAKESLSISAVLNSTQFMHEKFCTSTLS